MQNYPHHRTAQGDSDASLSGRADGTSASRRAGCEAHKSGSVRGAPVQTGGPYSAGRHAQAAEPPSMSRGGHPPSSKNAQVETSSPTRLRRPVAIAGEKGLSDPAATPTDLRKTPCPLVDDSSHLAAAATAEPCAEATEVGAHGSSNEKRMLPNPRGFRGGGLFGKSRWLRPHA